MSVSAIAASHVNSEPVKSSVVSFEDRQDLLGHRSGRITTHYSAPDIARLLAAANSICEPQQAPGALTLA